MISCGRLCSIPTARAINLAVEFFGMVNVIGVNIKPPPLTPPGCVIHRALFATNGLNEICRGDGQPIDSSVGCLSRVRRRGLLVWGLNVSSELGFFFL